jgi:hypothetical protein
MDISVYTWEFYPDRLADRDTALHQDTGHAAILVVDTENQSHYFSWWPPQDRTSGALHTLAPDESYDCNKMRRRYGDEDKAPDGIYSFSGTALDRQKMLKFMDDLHHSRTSTSWFATKGQFHKSIQNCSSAVAWALWKGGCGKYYNWPGHFVWHPNNLANYCQNLVRGVQKNLGAEHAKIELEMKTASPGPGAFELVYLL